ncbi:tetratricopeptide repeat protein 38 isoform X1 [Selaginella moellendorffii]|uniref:tetratricopeptide repeat protein 38 isoform X1 n=1 Tax=Selaginella moellendorffii TaxID=88036 RepID=UPI000D1C623C|nr:tetratricopeptide repeat protein 38 isoform X1 [Selaginella moellendorffii]|eukprot:XP_024520819.1 tetratricopeptide repeat protein 38 isoform X1 [Selaginella moellendorffii]
MQQERSSDVRDDQWGYPVRTSSDQCISYLNSYYQQVLSYGWNCKVILQAADNDEDCALANALAAGLADPSAALRYSERSKRNADRATQYERSVMEALDAIAEGSYDKALSSQSKVLENFPKDLASLKRAQAMAFSRGKSHLMLKFASQVLHVNRDRAYMYGMLAFSLVENDRTDEAEVAARRALSIEKHDVWAQHALCHVFQERQQYKDAIMFMESNSESWERCGSFLYSHNWWHLALCHLEGDDNGNAAGNALRIFDTRIWGDRERAEKDTFAVSLNALGLLLSLQVKGFGEYVGERVSHIAKLFVDESTWHKEWLLDLLVLWSLARSSFIAEARQLLSSLDKRAHMIGSTEEIHQMIVSVINADLVCVSVIVSFKLRTLFSTCQLASALYEYGSGNERAVSSLLGSQFSARELKVIGASNEQMRVFGHLWATASGLISAGIR